VMDADGAVTVAKDHVADVVEAAQHRNHDEAAMRERLEAGELTLDLLGLRR
jgi:regulator of RNase E activity RraA